MRWQIYGVWASLIISLIGLGLIIWTASPQAASLSVKLLFFIALFILFWGVVTLVMFSAKNRLANSQTPSTATYETMFYDSFFKGLITASIFILVISIRRLL